MLGHHHLNEVFFDDVPAGPDAVLGGVGEGWAVIRKALAHERVGIARYARCERLLSALGAELAPHWHDLPASLHAQWARALVQVRVARLLAYRTVHAQATGELPDVLRVERPHRRDAVRPVRGRGAVPGARGGRAGGGSERPAPRRHRGPLALRAGRHRGVGHDRGAAHDRVEGAARRVDVNPVLPDEAVEFRAAADKAFAALGGVDAARRAEDDPSIRADEVAAALAALGIDDVDPRGRPRLAGRRRRAVRGRRSGGAPLPGAGRAAPRRRQAARSRSSPTARSAVDHGDLFDEWRVAALDGPSGIATPDGRPPGHPPRPVRQRPRRSRPTSRTPPTTSSCTWPSPAGRCSAPWTGRWSSPSST